MTPTLFIRRAHLFVGLFLAPWVLAFGISALVIHNQTALSGWPHRSDIPPIALAAIKELHLPDAHALAAAQLQILNAREGNDAYTLIDGSAAYDGFYSLSLNWDSNVGKALISPDAEHGSITCYEPTLIPQKAPGNRAPIFTEEQIASHQRELSEILHAADPSLRNVGPLSLPTMRFQLKQGDRLLTARCDLQTGAIALTPVAPAPYWRFLHQLHTTHKYVPGPWYRWTWLLLANAVATALVFWVLSGVVMWWQHKPARGAGLIVIVVTATLFTVVLIGMRSQA